jgi:ankyrin repeat protein
VRVKTKQLERRFCFTAAAKEAVTGRFHGSCRYKFRISLDFRCDKSESAIVNSIITRPAIRPMHECLIQEGPDIFAVDTNRLMALHLACSFSNCEKVRLLLSALGPSKNRARPVQNSSGIFD